MTKFLKKKFIFTLNEIPSKSPGLCEGVGFEISLIAAMSLSDTIYKDLINCKNVKVVAGGYLY